MQAYTEEQRKALIEGEVTYSRLFEALKGLYEVEDDDAVWEIFNQTDDPLEDVVCALKLLTTKPPVAAPAVPEGWKLVPVEPTQEMVDACFEATCAGGIQKGYRAMLAAAPAPGGNDA